MTVSPVLIHTQYSADEEPEFELQYPSVRDRTYGVEFAVSATVFGVLIAVEPILEPIASSHAR